jgi:UDP-N-acetyl-D-mannosaminuronic acid dehydrogenase
VIGLGYVGLPLACVLADTGFFVTGVDIDRARIQALISGINPIRGREPGLTELVHEALRTGRLRASTDHTDLAGADIVLIAVETPIDTDHRPDTTALGSACSALAEHIRPGSLVIVESTLMPGTMRDVVRPLLQDKSGLVAGRDFHVGHCPERVQPGRLLEKLRNMNRTCGADDPATGSLMVEFYRTFVRGDLDVADCLTAEIVKTVENAWYDVEIAFANEIAVACDALGADAWEVRRLVNKSPERNVRLPGPGVGGHCIPKDPWLLAAALGAGHLRLIPSARAVNDGMPEHVMGLVEEALSVRGRSFADTGFALLGYAYREDTDDTRNSPSETIATQLRARGANLMIHDPYVSGYEGELSSILARADVAILMVAHREYREFDWGRAHMRSSDAVVLDTRNVLADLTSRPSMTVLTLGKAHAR